MLVDPYSLGALGRRPGEGWLWKRRKPARRPPLAPRTTFIAPSSASPVNSVPASLVPPPPAPSLPSIPVPEYPTVAAPAPSYLLRAPPGALLPSIPIPDYPTVAAMAPAAPPMMIESSAIRAPDTKVEAKPDGGFPVWLILLGLAALGG